ncbi:MAG TPA: hypothetical protein VHY84_03530 [Bryobacteraceae bacterium]|nr:hypothetical protein [Bryobacteraceae bacterium]
MKSLDAHNARFLLIGGYAVNAFGHVRNTVDMDLWIASDADNEQRVLQAIRDFAFPAALADLLHADDAMVRIPGIAQELKERTGAAAVFSFHSPHVLFILATQDRHVDAFRSRTPVIESGWKGHIAVREH